MVAVARIVVAAARALVARDTLTLQVGASSADIRQEATVRVVGRR